jgi:hypothetical protein
MRPWFIILLVVQFFFLILRWRTGDAHGALLMFAVWSVGVLSLAVGSSGVDAIYGGYFGLMAFVSGLLDLNLAIEHIVWTEWKQLKHDAFHKGDFSGLVRPAVYLACALLQLSSAFIAYMVYKEAETLEDWLDAQDETVPFFATQDQARVYSAALRHGERPRNTSPIAGPMKPFIGTPHKLP